MLGVGRFSVVYEGIWNDRHVAIKLLNPSARHSDLPDMQLVQRTFRSEAQTLMDLQRNSKNGNIISCWGQGDNYVILEKMPNGDLHSFLHSHSASQGRTFSEKEKLLLALQIATGMAYVHSQQIVHGDLHSSNILVSEKSFFLFPISSNLFWYSLILQAGWLLRWLISHSRERSTKLQPLRQKSGLVPLM